MIKKKIVTLTLGAILVLGSIGVAFAADANTDTETTNTTFARGNGMMLYASDLTVEELLNEKIDRIDQLVSDGSITEEQGEEYKTLITERMASCTVPGENRDSNERLGIGFGKGNGRGNGQGRGFGNGCGFGGITQ